MKQNILLALFFFLVETSLAHALNFGPDMLATIEMVYTASEKIAALFDGQEIRVLHGFRKVNSDDAYIYFRGQSAVNWQDLILTRGGHGEVNVVRGQPDSLPEDSRNWFDIDAIVTVDMLYNSREKLRGLLGEAPIHVDKASWAFIEGQPMTIRICGTTKKSDNDGDISFEITIKAEMLGQYDVTVTFH